MLTTDREQTDETRDVERILQQEFPSAECYRYNPGSLRIRIVDPRFDGLSRTAREEIVEPFLERLPEDTRLDVTMLVLITNAERSTSLVNLEFEDPSPSRF